VNVRPRIAFVDAPKAAPVALLELNDRDPLYVLREPEFSLGTVTDRQVTGTVRIKGDPSTVAHAMSTLARHLVRPQSWLMFQRTPASPPVFARCFATALGALDWGEAGSGVYDLPLSLDTDEGLYGAPVSVGPLTVDRDPTAATNPMTVALPRVLGDMETPLYLALTPPDATTVGLASYTLPAGSTHTVKTLDLTTLTSSTDTGAAVTGAGSSYVGGNYKETTFSTDATLRSRLTGGSVDLTPGSYRLLARVVWPSASAAGTYQFALKRDTGDAYTGDTVTVDHAAAAGVVARWVDLGVFHLPRSVSGPVGLDGYASASLGTSLAFQAGRTVGSTPIQWDQALFVPVDVPQALGSSFGYLEAPAIGGNDDWLTLDGYNDNDARYMYDPTGTNPFTAAGSDRRASVRGGLPVLTPGANNYLTIVQRVSPGGQTQTVELDASDTVHYRYWPRYANIRPDGG